MSKQTEQERMAWQIEYAKHAPSVADMKEVLWQALNGCTGADNCDDVVRYHGTWQSHMERHARRLTGRCFVVGHSWEATHANRDGIPTRERCKFCGSVREWSGGPPPYGRWDLLPNYQYTKAAKAGKDGGE